MKDLSDVKNSDIKNAIDEYYGDLGQHGCEKRKRYGIQIIGKKNSESA